MEISAFHLGEILNPESIKFGVNLLVKGWA